MLLVFVPMTSSANSSAYDSESDPDDTSLENSYPSPLMLPNTLPLSPFESDDLTRYRDEPLLLEPLRERLLDLR